MLPRTIVSAADDSSGSFAPTGTASIKPAEIKP